MKHGVLMACVVMAVVSGGSGALAGSRVSQPCAGVDTELSSARAQDYRRFVAASLTPKVQPSQVSIDKFMANGSWSVVYAATPLTDPGYFFFEAVGGRTRFKDVWGGIALPSDRPGLIAWARKLGAPKKLADCFAATASGR